MTAPSHNVRVHRFIGRPELLGHDPILMLGEFLSTRAADYPTASPRLRNCDSHARGTAKARGFSGYKGTIGSGGFAVDLEDLQWMTAGRGIVNSEMPVRLSREQEDERAHGLQLWINLPKEHKMCEPWSLALLDGQIPRARPQDGVVVKVIAGESHDIKSQIYNPHANNVP
ncbi:RmlC-like cupin domain-containing protein [Linnemannia elongata]|nr:RmlC-like cupin domain-containing protein [Linnemannia elongata]